MDINVEMKKLIQSALFCASEAAHYATEFTDDEVMQARHEAGAVDIALRGLTAIQAAKVLYITADNENLFIENVFQQYEIFVREVSRNFTTNHSHQWTLIEKDRLFDLVKGTELEVKPAYEE